MKNIHEDDIKVFQTRWVLSYLKGPISKDDIKKLMAQKIEEALNSPQTKSSPRANDNSHSNELSSKPILPNDLDESFSYISQQETYQMQPFLLTSCELNFYNTSKNIDVKQQIIEKIYLDETDSNVNWHDKEDLEDLDFSNKERTNTSYYNLPTFMQNARELKSIQREFTNKIYQNNKLTLYKNSSLKLLSKQDETLIDFKIRIQDRLNEEIDENIEKLQIKYEKEEKRLETKLEKLYIKLEKEKDQASAQTTDTLISIGSSILGAFFGKSMLSKTNVGKAASGIKNASKILKEKKDVKFVEAEIEELSNDMNSLKEKLEREIEEINHEYNISNYEIEETYIKPRRKDIYNVKISLLWEEA